MCVEQCVEQIQKEAKEFLQSSRIPHKQLPQILERMLQNKSALNEALGLNPDNLFRKEIKIQVDSSSLLEKKEYTSSFLNKATFEALKGEYQAVNIDIGTNNVNIIDLKGKRSSQKATRFLKKVITPDFVGRETAWLRGCVHEWQIKLTEDEQHILNYLANTANPRTFASNNKKTIESVIDKYLTKLGEISKSEGRRLVVSTNLFDFLTSSSNAAYTSCYSHDGCHFSGNLAYAVDDFTVLVYLYADNKIDYKLGRAWGYVFPELHKADISREYGAFYSAERTAATNFLGQLLGVEEPNIREVRDEYPSRVENSGPVYFDCQIHTMVHPAGKSQYPPLHFSKAPCLLCGEDHTNGARGLCKDCLRKRICASCGEVHDGNDMFSINPEEVKGLINLDSNNDFISDDRIYLCRDCFDSIYYRCNECGDVHLKSDSKTPTYTALKDGRVVCPECVRKYYFICAECGNYHNKQDKRIGEGRELCVDCFTSVYNVCDLCGTIYPKSEPECPQCIRDKEILRDYYISDELFAPGDFIICTRSEGAGNNLTKGRTYTAMEFSEEGTCVYLINNAGSRFGYYTERFKKLCPRVAKVS
jgi:hypothetical protein